MKKRIALVGYSGFVGSHLHSYLIKKYKKVFLFNSKNIKNIKKCFFDEIYFAALPATKWKINKNPKMDNNNRKKIEKYLSSTKCNFFFLISTIDVYNNHEPYGLSRLKFEKYVIKNFKKYIIIRLPGIFGKGLKKNVIYDLLNNNNINQINIKDQFQWLDLSDFMKFLKKNDLKKDKNKIIELFPEPLKNNELIKLFPGQKLDKQDRAPTIYKYRPKKGYFMKKTKVISKLKKFIINYLNDK